MFKEELNYWDKELSLKGHFPEAIKNRIEKGKLSKEFPLFILPYLEEAKVLFKRVPKVLDLGSGPLSQLNYGVENKLLNLYAVDPLAEEYKKLLQKYNIPKQKYELIQCSGEFLSEKFGENYFDFVWIHNAIDHSQDPVKVFSEIAKVAKSGAYIFFLGWENEGKKNNYFGLHRHDIFWNDQEKKFKIKTHGKEIVNLVDNNLPVRFWDYYIQNFEKRRWLKGVWKKI